jgi:hypothetical protein
MGIITRHRGCPVRRCAPASVAALHGAIVAFAEYGADVTVNAADALAANGNGPKEGS